MLEKLAQDISNSVMEKLAIIKLSPGGLMSKSSLKNKILGKIVKYIKTPGKFAMPGQALGEAFESNSNLVSNLTEAIPPSVQTNNILRELVSETKLHNISNASRNPAYHTSASGPMESMRNRMNINTNDANPGQFIWPE